MLERILEKVGKNRFVQTVMVASVLSYSTIAVAKPIDDLYSAEPKAENILDASLEFTGEDYQLKVEPIFLAQTDDIPPYLKEKKKDTKKKGEVYYVDPAKKKKKEEGGTPDYLSPDESFSTEEKEEESKVGGWAMLVGGILSIGLGALLIGDEICASDRGTNYNMKCKPTETAYLGYGLIGTGSLVGGLGLWGLLK